MNARRRSRRPHAFAAVALALALVVRSDVGSAATPDRAAIPRVTTDGFANAKVPYRFVFPRDHAAHPAYQTEWWYYTGHLVTSAGRRFGYELTFFRFGLRPGDPAPKPGESPWRGNQIFPAHFAITDERDGRFVHVEKFTREAIGLGGAASDRLAVHADRWTLRGSATRDPRDERMALHAIAGDDAIDLVQIPQKPPAIHGHDGVSEKAACATCASHYYSYTRLATAGTLVFAGVRYPVTGLSWMDHEFGSSEMQRDMAGWDWFAIQLDDRREVMLYLLRRKDGTIVPESSGSLVAPDGTVTYLPRSAFTVTATGSWTSGTTHGVYPSGWHVAVPSARLDLTITPTVLDQELAYTSGDVSYWEGSVRIAGPGGARLGVGYVELTGYAGFVSL